jgi:hypothetical protein
MWKVMCGKKDIGIIETNYAWASKYWASRPLFEGKKLWLKEVKNEN